MRIAAENQLAEFLREIREVTVVRKHREEQGRLQEAKPEEINWTDAEGTKERSSDIAISDPDRATFHSSVPPLSSETEKQNEDNELDVNERNLGGMFSAMRPSGCSSHADWVPGQDVIIDYAAIIEILIQQLDPQREPFMMRSDFH